MKHQRNLKRDFGHHPPEGGAVQMHEYVRALFRDIAQELDETLPPSREKSIAFTELETAMFWANAAISREISYTPDSKNETSVELDDSDTIDNRLRPAG